MGARRVVIRVLGLASTIRGFAYSLTEGPGCLIDVGNRETPAKGPRLDRSIDLVLQDSRPLFVAVEHMSGLKQERFRQFSDAVIGCCESHEIKVITVRREDLLKAANLRDGTKWDVAEAMVRRFPEIAHKLPERRKQWKSEDDRLGIFTALASALSVWRSFRVPGDDAGQSISSSEPSSDVA